METFNTIILIAIFILLAFVVYNFYAKKQNSASRTDRLEKDDEDDKKDDALRQRTAEEVENCVKLIAAPVQKYHDEYFAYFLSTCIRKHKLHTSVMEKMTGLTKLVTTYPKFAIFDECKVHNISSSILYEALPIYAQRNRITLADENDQTGSLEKHVRASAEKEVKEKLKPYVDNDD